MRPPSLAYADQIASLVLHRGEGEQREIKSGRIKADDGSAFKQVTYPLDRSCRICEKVDRLKRKLPLAVSCARRAQQRCDYDGVQRPRRKSVVRRRGRDCFAINDDQPVWSTGSLRIGSCH